MEMGMKNMIKVEIYYDGDFYCAKCLDFDIFSQGKTLDEVVENIKESIILYFEDEPLELEGYGRTPSLFSMMDLGEIHV
jgi:predicted RNase H-like HicB family nuclease